MKEMSAAMAPSWIQMPTTPHRASIAGKIVDGATGHPVGGAVVEMVSMPSAFAARLAGAKLRYGSRWEKADERPDRTKSAADGCFRFIDLPGGDYTLAFELSHAKYRYGWAERVFTVEGDGAGPVQVETARVELSPTGVRGQVLGLVEGLAVVLPLARVRLDPTGELARADEEGKFYMGGIEPGGRRFCVGAVGFQTAAKTCAVIRGEIVDLGLITLEPHVG